ncbi:hypothetical protein Nmel_002340, partial [Mimus melanotis]
MAPDTAEVFPLPEFFNWKRLKTNMRGHQIPSCHLPASASLGNGKCPSSLFLSIYAFS